MIASVASVALVAIAVVAAAIIILTLVFVRVKRKRAVRLQHNYEIPQLPTSKMKIIVILDIKDKKASIILQLMYNTII